MDNYIQDSSLLGGVLKWEFQERGISGKPVQISSASLQKLLWFWTEAPPIGISGVNVHTLVDVDDTGFYVKSVYTKYERGHTTSRVVTPTHHIRSDPKLNIILAIEPGDPILPTVVLGSTDRSMR